MIDVIIPAVIQEQALFDLFLSNLATIQSDRINKIRIICNRWRLFEHSASLYEEVIAHTDYAVDLVTDKERSVAGAWNKGIHDAMEDGIDRFVITAMDVACAPGDIDRMVAHAEDRNFGLCSGHAHNLFTLSRLTIDRVGWFDKEFKPAYFEDNDYMVRMSKAGVPCGDAPGIEAEHGGSMTIGMDGEMAHHVRHWFPKNQARLKEKWGFAATIPLDYQFCYKTPYDSGNTVAWWPEQAKEGYEPWGGIHD